MSLWVRCCCSRWCCGQLVRAGGTVTDDAREDERHEDQEDEREASDQAQRTVLVLLGLMAFVVIIGTIGNLVDSRVHVEVAALGLLSGAVVTIVVGKAITK